MSIEVKLRRGTTAEHASFIGAEGEVTVDTDKDSLVVHDGVTAGGFPLMRADNNQRIIDPFKQGTHSELDFYFDIGIVRKDNAVTKVATGYVALTDNATNYVECSDAGVVSANVSGYTAGSVPLYAVVTSGGDITSVTDDRCFFDVATGGGGTTTTFTLDYDLYVINEPSDSGFYLWTITNEAVVLSGGMGTFVHKPVKPGSEVITDGGSTTYVRGTNYTIDNMTGVITSVNIPDGTVYASYISISRT